MWVDAAKDGVLFPDAEPLPSVWPDPDALVVTDRLRRLGMQEGMAKFCTVSEIQRMPAGRRWSIREQYNYSQSQASMAPEGPHHASLYL